MKFDPKFWEELKAKNNIAEVIGGYLPLTKRGGQYWACCPFHHEKTPSFAIKEDDGYYHCFGCGASGDVVKFVQNMESTDFITAVKILADRAKIKVPEGEFDDEKAAEFKRKKDVILKILLETARFYLGNLYGGDPRADRHLNYIQKRRISPSVAKKFGLGASLDYESLPRHLSSLGFLKSDLLESGAVTEDRRGNLSDALAGRLIFPIINAMDEVVAFGGRDMDGKSYAKYKNTRETPVFNKRKNLYNVNLLKKLKREQKIDEVIMVEGYMDAISLYQAGFKNVVASMGTSLTKEQARLVKRYCDKVLISYDGDFAGQSADLRGLEILKTEDITVRVVPLPDGKDPDDVAKESPEAYRRCLEAAIPLIDYKLSAVEKNYDLNKSDEKRMYVAEALKVVREAESESEKEDLLKRVRDKTGITYQSLERDLNNLPELVKTPPRQAREAEEGADKFTRAARFILAAKLFSAPYAKGFDIDSVSFSDATHKAIAQYIAACETRGEKLRPSDLFDVLNQDSPEFNAILELNLSDKLTGAVAERFFSDSVSALKSETLSEKIRTLTEDFSKETDVKRRQEIAAKIAEYTRALKRRG
ncbi:MAG: DNA primase [Candidatus Borkfalkiaceae bacterium]|nr:DNA primase [Clostridia bacterium]MDY6223233.1 DNA primase [Christensenellaceae bacterium]